MRIRNLEEKDWADVEALTRRAFYNIYIPGCVEHYLVHIMRAHADFVPELALVGEEDGRIVGSILYTRARLVDENGAEKPILTFGPICVDPARQRKGLGKALMARSFERAAALGYGGIVIFGDPKNYVSSGFQSAKKYNICRADGKFPAAMLAKELVPHALDGGKWAYYDSPVMNVDMEAAQAFDAALQPMEKKYQPSQEEFYIMSHAFIED